MNYVYCGAYQALLFALYLRNLGKEITIIVDHRDMAKYCANEKINCIKFEFISPTSFSAYKLLPLKKKLDQIIEKIDFKEDDSFYLASTRAKGFAAYYLAKEFAKKGGNVYHANPSGVDFEKFKPPWYKPINFKGDLFRSALKLFLGLDLQRYVGNSNFPKLGIDHKFKEKHNIKDNPLEHFSGKMILEVVKKSKINYKKCDNLIIDQGSFGKILKLGSIGEMYKNLSELPIDFAFKKHPKSTQKDRLSDWSSYELFKDKEQVPGYIPVELFLNNVENSVISIFSAPLVTASKLDHLKSISLLELVEFTDPSYKNKVKDRLTKESNNKILFPASYDELTTLLLE